MDGRSTSPRSCRGSPSIGRHARSPGSTSTTSLVVKVEGDFVWHEHGDTDDFFPVLQGRLIIRSHDRDDVALGPGALYVVPSGVERKPVAEEETHLLLIEPTGPPDTRSKETTAPREEL